VNFTIMYSNEDAHKATGIVTALQDLKNGQELTYDGQNVTVDSKSGI